MFDLTYVSHWYVAGQVFLKDTEERACALIAGPAPNRWGLTSEGIDLFESIRNMSADYGEFLCTNCFLSFTSCSFCV